MRLPPNKNFYLFFFLLLFFGLILPSTEAQLRGSMIHKFETIDNGTQTDDDLGPDGMDDDISWNSLPDDDYEHLPPSEHKVSVIILNEARPKTLQSSSLMPTLLQHPSVQEVVLLHTNPQSSFSWNHKKIVNIDASQEADEMGLSVKFYFCQLVQSDWVLFIQDNLEFQDKTLNELLVEYAKNTKRIVGNYGKDAESGSSLYQTFYHGYSSQHSERDVEVVLSQFMVLERGMCSRFFEYSHLIWEDVVVSNGEGPLWNGEDIFMSLVANHVYDRDGGKNNYAMPWLDVREVAEEVEDYRYEKSKFDLNGSKYHFWDFHWWITLMNRHRHYSYREKLWKKARDRLQMSEF